MSATLNNNISEAFRVLEKFDGENFHLWKFKMQLVLEEKDLWEIVTGSEEHPGNSDEKIKIAYERKERKALATICLNLKDSQLSHVRAASSAKEAWSKLEKLYETKSLANHLFLRRKFFNTRKEEGDTMITHINKVKTMAEQLDAIGAPVKADDVVMTLLSSLPTSYDNLIVALESRSDDLSLEFTTARLIHEEKRRKETQQDGQEKGAEAFFVSKHKSKKNFGQHDKRKKPGNCNYCKKPGHWARDCRKRAADQNEQKKVDQANQASTEHVFISALNISVAPNIWFIDSGASQHITYQDNIFSSYEKITPKEVYLGDNTSHPAIGKGTVKLNMKLNSGSTMEGTLTDVLHVPGIAKNLFSVSKATREGLKIKFENKGCTISKGNKILAEGLHEQNLYRLNCQPVGLQEEVNHAKDGLSLTELWHQRLGHLGLQGLKMLSQKNMVDGLEKLDFQGDEMDLCSGCIEGKQQRNAFPKQGGTRAKELLGIVHSDLCGPMQTPSLGAARYFITFTDDKSRHTTAYFLKTKDQSLEKFKEYKAWAENFTGKKIKILRTDNGGEFISKKFNTFCRINGIQQQTTAPYSPQQNGVAERLNRTVVEHARCMLKHKSMKNHFWAEAVSTAVYLKNRSPTKALDNKTPQEVWSGQRPSISHLKIFGCIAYMHIPKEKRSKLDSKSQQCIFLGYLEGSKAYRLYDPIKQQLITSRDVIFDEESKLNNEFGIIPLEEEKSHVLEDVQINSSPEKRQNGEVEDEIFEEAMEEVQHSRPGRERKTPREWWKVQANIVNCEEPQTLQEALKGDHAKEWKNAMNSEYSSILKNGTWTLSNLPPGRKAIGCKWIFKVKKNADGSIERYKARLVAKGFAQTEGVDFQETFAPVAKFTSIRCLLAIAAAEGLDVHQMDVKTAFLNGDLEEEIYMVQPEGFVEKGSEHLVCKLKKALYGLKQAPRAWYQKINNYLHNNDFVRTSTDHSVYIKESEGNKIIISIYVDDLLLVSNNLKYMERFKINLAQ
jgi:transposase InsO family protein